jgi:hypothetical protein
MFRPQTVGGGLSIENGKECRARHSAVRHRLWSRTVAGSALKARFA